MSEELEPGLGQRSPGLGAAAPQRAADPAAAMGYRGAWPIRPWSAIMSDTIATPDSFSARFSASRESSEDVWEVLYTTRAIRRLRPDPIPDAIVHRLLDAAIRAPSGGNQQSWRFIVIRDQATKEKLGELYRASIQALFASGYGQTPAGVTLTPEQEEAAARMRKSAAYLGEHFARVPLYVMGCIRAGKDAGITAGASIYPAIWSLQLAARALGIGSTLTTVHRMRDAEVRELLGLPEGYETAALVPLGYPRGTFAVGPRQPLETVSYSERWGTPLAGGDQ
jgi:nitroreductase